MAQPRIIQYRFATTAVQFAGSRAISSLKHRQEPAKTAYTATAKVIVRADLGTSEASLEIPKRRSSDTTFDLKLTDDGRLTSSHLTSSGRGTDVLAAVGKIVGEVVLQPRSAIAAPSAAAHGAKSGPTKEPESNPHDAEVTRLTGKRDALVAALETADLSQTNDITQSLLSRLKLVQSLLDAEVAAQTAWLAEADVSSSDHSAVMDVASLVARTGDEPPRISELTGVAKDVYERLGLVATISGGHSTEDIPEGPLEGLWYRRPRRARIAIWEANTVVDGPLVLVSDDEIDVVDSECALVEVPIDVQALFGESDLSVTFSDSGALIGLGGSNESGFADALSALAAIPDNLTDGAKSGKAFEKAFAAAPPADPDAKEIAQLEVIKTKLKLKSQIAKLSRPS